MCTDNKKQPLANCRICTHLKAGTSIATQGPDATHENVADKEMNRKDNVANLPRKGLPRYLCYVALV